MQHLEVSGAVRPLYGSLGVKGLTNQNSIQEEIKSILKSGKAYYHSVQNILSSSLLYKNMHIITCITIILHLVIFEYEALSLKLSEKHY